MLLGNCSGGGDHQLEVGSTGLSRDGGGGRGGGVDDGVQLKKGPWTAAEDAILTEYVRKHGEGNWNAVQRNTGLARCGKSCRLRWANHLRPNLKKGAFSPEEERLIVELHAQLGNKWARMAAQLPGRTDNEIKNYWNTRIKRRHRQGLTLYPPEIQPQHQHQHQMHPQSSHSHHPYRSQPSTPTTPTSPFYFQTTTTPVTTPTGHQHYHMPPSYYSHSPSPTPLSPSPSPLSPNLQSPHQPAFPTLTLFDTNNNNNNNNASNANAGSNNMSNTCFNIRRTPPLLQTPPRFKRFHSDPSLTNLSSTVTNGINSNNININNNNSFGSNNFQGGGGGGGGSFSLPFSPYLTSPSSPSLVTSPQGNCNTSTLMNPTNRMLSLPSFSSLPVSFSTQNSSLMLRNPDENDCILSSGSAFGLKPELPSNQLLSQNCNAGNAEICFDNEKMSVSCSGSGLLEDLLEEAQALAGNFGESSRKVSDDQKPEFSGFNQWSDSSSLNLSSEFKPKEEAGGQMNTMNEDLTKLLNVIPSMKVPEWYSDSGEASNCQSSVVTDDNIGLEMQQIASMLRVDSTPDHVRPPGSCSYDNLPGIC